MPLGMGTEKFLWAEDFWLAAGGGGDDAPLTGSRSISMELRPLMAEVERADRRFRSSGGRFKGWVSGSNLLLRREEVGSVDWRASRDFGVVEDFRSR